MLVNRRQFFTIRQKGHFKLDLDIVYMLYPYRVLRQDTSIGLVEATYHTTLIDAYRDCLPDVTCHRCHLLINGIEHKLINGEELIRVTCYPKVVYWIESLMRKHLPAPIPELPSKIDCCHPLD